MYDSRGRAKTELGYNSETGKREIRQMTVILKSTKTTIPFIKNHEFDYKWLLWFLGDAADKWAWLLYAIISMIVWNALTTYWIYFSTAVGVVFAILLNSLFMAFTLSLFHYSRTILKHNSAYITFIIYWITFEYLHLNWDLTWSWMNLGNGFANHPAWVQWYEYTGCFGGTFWILLVNFMIFRTIKFFINKEKTFNYRILFSAACSDLIIIPIIISLFIYYYHEDKGKLVNVAIVQPNIDPYNEKFGGLTSEQN